MRNSNYVLVFIIFIVLNNFSHSQQSLQTLTETDSDVKTYWSKFSLDFIQAQSFLLTTDSLNDENADFLANVDPAAFYLNDDYFDYKCPVNGIAENNACTLPYNVANVSSAGDYQNYLYMIFTDGSTNCKDPFYYDNNAKRCLSNIYLGKYRSASISNNKLVVTIPPEILKVQQLNSDSRPDWNTGTLYFSNQNATVRYKCDATVTGDHSVILTAANCVVKPNGEMYKNFMFVSTANRGTSTITKISFPSKYVSTKLPYKVAYDYAFLKLRTIVTPGWAGFSLEHFAFEHGISEVLSTVSNGNLETAFMNISTHPTIPNTYVFSYLQQVDSKRIPGAILIKQYNDTAQVFGNFAFSVLSSVSETGVGFAPILDDNASDAFNDVK